MRRGDRWGPGGSVGFEIATGAATATATSDLDLILRQDVRLGPNEATDLLSIPDRCGSAGADRRDA